MEAPATPTPGSALRRRLGNVLEAALARVLALDPAAREALQPLEGRRIVLELSAPAIALSLTVEGGRLRVGPARPQADLSMRAPLSALLARALGGSAGTGRIALSGDAELAQQLQRLLRDFSPDLEAALGNAFGDVLGYQLARALTGAFAVARRSGGRFARDVADYLTEESRDLVGAAELEAFCDDVDAIRDDVERLHKRMQRLQATAPGGR